MGPAASEYAEGLLFFIPMLAGCMAAAAVVARRRFPGLAPTELVLAWFAFAGAAVVLAHVLPGMLGALTRGTPVVTAALLLAAALAVPRSGGQPAAPPDAARPSPAWSWAIAVSAAATAAVGALAYLVSRSTRVVDSVDSVTFHLPTVARWIQNESIWGLHQFTPEFSNATYPHSGLVMQLAAILPWHDAFLARYVNLPFLVALAVAVYAIARELRAPRSTAVLAGAAATVLPAVAQPALEQAQVDAPGLAWFAIGVLFLARWARTRDRLELLPAGIGLGLAFGTKWYHAVFVPLVVALVFGSALIAGRSWRPLVRPFAVLTGWVSAAGGFWLIRNWVETANPVYPAKVGPIFDAPYSRLDAIAGFTVSDYLTDGEVWRDWLLPAYEDRFGYLPVLLAGALLLAAVVARRRRPEDGPVLLAVVATAALALAYTLLPLTAYGPRGQPYLVGENARYAVPAVLGGLLVLAWLSSRLPRLRGVLEIALLLTVADCLRRAYPEVHAGDVARALLVVFAGAALVAAAGLAAGRARLHVTVVVALAALLFSVAVGESLRRRAHADSYARYDPALAWIQANASAGSRIGLSGLWSLRGVSPVLPAFGPALDNEVEFVGPFVEHTLRQYNDRGSYQAAVRRGDYDLIVLGLGFARELPPERVRRVAWTRDLGYRPVARSNRLLLLARPD